MKAARLILGVWVMVLGFALPGQAQARPAIAGPPDVVIVVYQQPGGADQVDITYAQTVPHTQASQDIAALTQATGWQISTSSIKDAYAPMETRLGAMTSIEFQVPGVIQDSTHSFPVETFTKAFHSYKRLNIVFFVSPQFQFQGSRAYADNDIKMALDQQGTTYTYQIEILSPNFGSLPLASSVSAVQTGTDHRASGRIILLGILVAAALIGLAVYFLTARLTPKREAVASVESDDEAETRLEVGTPGRGN
ncbi:MAG: hypothetical protein ACRYFS_05135 [Janthinobacterium lividum]